MTDYTSKTYGRNAEAAQVLKMFIANRNISMPGPRRLGKSFFLDRLVTCLRPNGWHAVKVEIAGLANTRDVFRELCNRLSAETPLIKSVFRWSAQRLTQALGSRTETNGTWYQQLTTHDYETDFERLIKAMNEDKSQRWAILIDEIPIFLKALHDKGPEGIALALNFMNLLARLMQNYSRVRWLITGSIGMEPLAKEGNYMGVLAKFDNFELEPLSVEEATDFLCDRAQEGGFLYRSVITQTEAQYLIQATGWRAAFYLDALAQKLEGTPSNDAVQAKQLVDAAVTNLLKSTESQKFATWEEHLNKHYKKNERELAFAILISLAENTVGKSLNALLPSLNSPTLTKGSLKLTLQRMDVEGFVVCSDWDNDDETILFRNLLLRLWWKRWKPQATA
jgi:uncharacterized protein